jgi:hypothetical protein
LFRLNKKRKETLKMTAIALNGLQMKIVFNGISMWPEHASADDNFASTSRHYRRESVKLMLE